MGRHTFSTEKAEVDDFLERKDNKSAYLRKLIRADMQGPGTELVGLEMQIKTLEKQAQTKAQEEEMLQEQAEELRELKQSLEGTQDRRLNEAREQLSDTPKDPSNPAIQNWAERMDLTPEQLCERLE
jgi:DNA repair ATPase RecN